MALRAHRATSRSHAYSSDEVRDELVQMLAKACSREIDLFRQWDANEDGRITKKEFRRGVKALGIDIDPED